MTHVHNILRSLPDQPSTPSTVDIERAIIDARRRRLRNNIVYAVALVIGAFAAIAICLAVAS
jgi:hypothetical protein